MPGVALEKRSPLKELIPIEVVAGSSQGKGKSREEKEMDKGAIEKAQSPSLTMSKYADLFHEGDSAFVYNWIDDETGDSNLQVDMKESEWLSNRSYFDVNEEESLK